jgi:KipI family sensor histidine kinase inhibitor
VNLRFLPSGDLCTIAQVDSLADAHELLRRIDAAGFAADVVCGSSTVLVEPGGADVERRLLGLAAGERTSIVAPLRVHEISVVYDGPDLPAIAESLDMTVDDVIAAHASSEWTVAFIGFGGGFPYLVGGDPRLRLARRETPRTHVPAGSVAIAEQYCGIYPREGPGGWHLLGRTDAPIFDASRTPPSALAVGDRVRFAAR